MANGLVQCTSITRTLSFSRSWSTDTGGLLAVASQVVRQRVSTRLPRRSSGLDSWLSCLMSASNNPVFSWDRRVEFAETDAAGIVHFSSFFLYMEQAEHAMFRHFGWTVFPRSQGPLGSDLYTWPRVHCSCDYRSPAFFEDLLSIDLHIDRIGAKSITYRHVVRRSSEILAEGKITAVCSRVDPKSHEICSCEIPEPMISKLKTLAYPSTGTSSDHLPPRA